MGQIIASINEAGVNELFVKLFNAMPDQNFNLSQQAAAGPVQVRLSANSTLRALDQPANAALIDLRGDTLVPPIRYATLPLQLLTQLQGTVSLSGWNRSVGLQVTTSVLLAGKARVTVERRPAAWVPRLEFDAAETSISFAGSRNDFVNAIRDAVAHIDTSPLPGLQSPPGAVLNQAGNLAGQVFDLLQPQISATATQLARSITAQTRVLLGPEVPARYGVQVPGGGGTVDVQVTQVTVNIGANQASVSATFV